VPISLAQIGSLTAPTICASVRLSLSAARPLKAANILPQAASERNRKRAKARPVAAAGESGHAPLKRGLNSRALISGPVVSRELRGAGAKQKDRLKATF